MNHDVGKLIGLDGLEEKDIVHCVMSDQKSQFV